ncbi:MAG: TMEM165/GDT1 family protein [Coriobacteriales bacterium]
MLYVFAVSLILVMIGELADKSQLLALVLATRYGVWQVLLGILSATFVVHFFSAGFGQLVGGFIPVGVMPWVSGVLFVFFGLWTLRGDSIDDEEESVDRGARLGPVLAVAVPFFLAELGDKTQIMTITIAADPGGALLSVLKNSGPSVSRALAALGIESSGTLAPSARFWGVTLGSTLGMVIADALAIGIGRVLGARLPERLLTRISGAVFIGFGVLTMVAPYLAE